jgi:hypothetical protein
MKSGGDSKTALDFSSMSAEDMMGWIDAEDSYGDGTNSFLNQRDKSGSSIFDQICNKIMSRDKSYLGALEKLIEYEYDFGIAESIVDESDKFYEIAGFRDVGILAPKSNESLVEFVQESWKREGFVNLDIDTLDGILAIESSLVMSHNYKTGGYDKYGITALEAVYIKSLQEGDDQEKYKEILESNRTSERRNLLERIYEKTGAVRPVDSPIDSLQSPNPEELSLDGKSNSLNFFKREVVNAVDVFKSSNPEVSLPRRKKEIKDAIQSPDDKNFCDLVKAGVSFDIALDSEGNRAVHLAALLEDTNCFRALVKVGANPDALNNNGHTVFQHLMRKIFLGRGEKYENLSDENLSVARCYMDEGLISRVPQLIKAGMVTPKKYSFLDLPNFNDEQIVYIPEKCEEILIVPISEKTTNTQTNPPLEEDSGGIIDRSSRKKNTIRINLEKGVSKVRMLGPECNKGFSSINTAIRTASFMADRVDPDQWGSPAIELSSVKTSGRY